MVYIFRNPPGASQTLIALVMLHCPSKGHTQQIALAMVQKPALQEWHSRRHQPSSHLAFNVTQQRGCSADSRGRTMCGMLTDSQTLPRSICCSSVGGLPPSGESKPSMQRQITLWEAMWLMKSLRSCVLWMRKGWPVEARITTEFTRNAWFSACVTWALDFWKPMTRLDHDEQRRVFGVGFARG